MKAFTLIEVMVSTIILAILTIGIYLILNSGEMAYRTDMGLLELKQPTLRAIDFMTRELREAKVVNITPTTDENFDQIVFSTNNKSNVQYYCDGVAGAGALYDINHDNAVNQLIREYPPFTYKVLANNITRLKFLPIPFTGKTLFIELGACKVAGQRQLPPFTLQQEVRLRNE